MARAAFTQKLSVGSGGGAHVAYAMGMLFSLKTHRELFASAEHADDGEAPWPMGLALATLAGVTLLVALVSEIFVESVQKAAEAFGMSAAFVGFIVVALVGGAAEMASAFSGARKNRLDLSVGIALGSASQIALFVAPVLVLLSYVIGPTPMDLQLWPGAVVMVLIATLTVALVTNSGHSTWFVGVLGADGLSDLRDDALPPAAARAVKRRSALGSLPRDGVQTSARRVGVSLGALGLPSPWATNRAGHDESQESVPTQVDNVVVSASLRKEYSMRKFHFALLAAAVVTGPALAQAPAPAPAKAPAKAAVTAPASRHGESRAAWPVRGRRPARQRCHRRRHSEDHRDTGQRQPLHRCAIAMGFQLPRLAQEPETRRLHH